MILYYSKEPPRIVMISNIVEGPGLGLWVLLTGPKPKGIKVETFRIDYLIRTPKVENLSLQPISLGRV